MKNIKRRVKALVLDREGKVLIKREEDGGWGLPVLDFNENTGTSQEIQNLAKEVARRELGVGIIKTLEPYIPYNEIDKEEIKLTSIVPMFSFNNEVNEKGDWVRLKDIDKVEDHITREKIKDVHRIYKEKGEFFFNDNPDWNDYKIIEDSW